MAELHSYQVILRPIISEESNRRQEALNQYTFEVAETANKIQIRKAVEDIFGVEVVKINTLIMPAKRGKRGRKEYVRSPQWKKAIVTLKPGDEINLFNV